MSAPAPYLLQVTSRPTQVSIQAWKEWYIKEHLSDLVNSHTAVRASVYEAVDLPGVPPANSDHKFLAIYQSDFAEPVSTTNYKSVRTTSKVFEGSGAASDAFFDNGDFDARNYALIQTYDPNGIGEVPSPEIITAEAQPADPDDYDAWFRAEHLAQLAALPGYRRTLRYKLGPKMALTKGEDVPVFLALHEVEDAKRFIEGRAEAAKTAKPSEWAVRNAKGCRIFTLRGWKLVHKEGY